MSLTTENKWRGLLLYTSTSGATDELPAHHVRLLIFTVVVMDKTGRFHRYFAPFLFLLFGTFVRDLLVCLPVWKE